MLKLLVLLLPCKQSDLSKRTLKLVHIVPQRSHTNLSVCSVHYVNYLVSQFELFIHVAEHCRYQHGVKFSSLAKFSAALTSWFLNRINWLTSASPIVRFWTSRTLCCHVSWILWVLHPSGWNPFRTKKIVQIWAIKIFVNGTRHYWNCLYQSGSLHTLFS